MLWHPIHVPISIVKPDHENFIFLKILEFYGLFLWNNHLTPLLPTLHLFLKIFWRSTSVSSMTILLNKYFAFRKSTILYIRWEFVSLNSWPKFVRSSMIFAMHFITSTGISTVNSPNHGFANFGLVLRRRRILLWTFHKALATIPREANNIWILRFLDRSLYFSFKAPTAPSSSEKNSLTILISSPVWTLDKQI